ncbi:dihydrofolate reductase family protein [Pseudolysinimonas sp.]|uniref:dihydrofolate reductase family protein n=1 Tax=Pseudolysinimonas sp. TaxID=2680009 RepID=UPI003F7D68F5
MSLRAHNIAVSLDGFATGEGPSLEVPFGHAGTRLMQWFFATPTWPGRSPGEEQTLAPGAAEDDIFARRAFEGFGAEIMGAGKFGPPGWQDDPDWRGWWGEDPPFGTPVFVLTHRPRPTLAVGSTTFHFLDATPEDALRRAEEAAGDLDVRLGGGPTTIREFLTADLVDAMHLVLVPIVLGRGERIWDGQEGLEKRFDVRSTTTGSGVTHLEFVRKGR